MLKKHACKQCGGTDPEAKFGWRTVRGKRYKKFICNRCLHVYNRRFRKDEALALRREKKYSAKEREERRLGIKRAMWIKADARTADRRRGMKNDLTLEFIESLIGLPCSYCGDTALQMTLDRIDNSQGHNRSNVVASCIRCNMIRRDMPHDAWLLIVPAIRNARKLGMFGDWTGSIHKSRCSSGGLEHGTHNAEGEVSNASTATSFAGILG